MLPCMFNWAKLFRALLSYDAISFLEHMKKNIGKKEYILATKF